MTNTATSTATMTSGPLLTANIVDCDTGVDITHQIGKVANVYATIRNLGSLDFTNIFSALSASDKDREHPNQTVCVPMIY